MTDEKVLTPAEMEAFICERIQLSRQGMLTTDNLRFRAKNNGISTKGLMGAIKRMHDQGRLTRCTFLGVVHYLLPYKPKSTTND